MAGDWLKIEAATPDKPEVFEIATVLKISPAEAFGRLFLVWRWFDQHTEKGNAANVTSSYLNHISGVAGFAEAMQQVGWLSLGSEGQMGLKLPNFSRHNGQTAKNRVLTARRVATHKKRSANAVVTPSPLPREEKRRVITPISPSGAFLRFWTAWPKHIRKHSQGKCWILWRRSDFDQVAPVILGHVESLKASDEWTKEGGKYVPAPSVYLNQRRWEGAEAQEPEDRKVAMP